MKGYIYILRNTITDMFYLGSTKHPDKRHKQHLYSLSKGTHINIHLQRAYNKYGGDSFVFDVIDTSPIQDMYILEQNYLNWVDWDLTYNLSKYAGGGYTLSYHPNITDIRDRMSSTMKKLHSASDNPWANRDILGDNNPNWKGGISTKLCECGRVIMKCNTYCAMCRPRTGKDNPFFGRLHSDSSKKNMSKNGKGGRRPNAIRLEICGVCYASCADAAKHLGIHVTVVHYRCKKSKNVLFADWRAI